MHSKENTRFAFYTISVSESQIEVFNFLEMYRANISLVTGRLVRRSKRTYLKPGAGNQNSWKQGYKVSLSHSPEVYVLSGYAIGLMIVMAWT